MNTRSTLVIQPAPHARVILFLLIVLNIINMVDRQFISSFGPLIADELNLSDTQFGLLTGSMFVTFYAVMGLFVDRLADVMQRPRLIAAGLLVWSALTAVSGAAVNFIQIGVALFFIGVGEACLTPAAISILSDLSHRATEEQPRIYTTLEFSSVLARALLLPRS